MRMNLRRNGHLAAFNTLYRIKRVRYPPSVDLLPNKCMIMAYLTKRNHIENHYTLSSRTETKL